MKQPKTAILLLQIGSPETPTLWAVARYLGRFLSDRRLINLANPWRWLLVYCLILPFRSWRSSRAYKKVWTAEGSPLVVHTQGLAQKLEAQLGDDFAVRAGMANAFTATDHGLNPSCVAARMRTVHSYPGAQPATRTRVERLPLLSVETSSTCGEPQRCSQPPWHRASVHWCCA